MWQKATINRHLSWIANQLLSGNYAFYRHPISFGVHYYCKQCGHRFTSFGASSDGFNIVVMTTQYGGLWFEPMCDKCRAGVEERVVKRTNKLNGLTPEAFAKQQSEYRRALRKLKMVLKNAQEIGVIKS